MICKREAIGLLKIPRTLLQLYEGKDLQLPPRLVSIKAPPSSVHVKKKKLTTLSFSFSSPPWEKYLKALKDKRSRKEEKEERRIVEMKNSRFNFTNSGLNFEKPRRYTHTCVERVTYSGREENMRARKGEGSRAVARKRWWVYNKITSPTERTRHALLLWLRLNDLSCR